jgi:hypothetical protein
MFLLPFKGLKKIMMIRDYKDESVRGKLAKFAEVDLDGSRQGMLMTRLGTDVEEVLKIGNLVTDFQDGFEFDSREVPKVVLMSKGGR